MGGVKSVLQFTAYSRGHYMAHHIVVWIPHVNMINADHAGVWDCRFPFFYGLLSLAISQSLWKAYLLLVLDSYIGPRSNSAVERRPPPTLVMKDSPRYCKTKK